MLVDSSLVGGRTRSFHCVVAVFVACCTLSVSGFAHPSFAGQSDASGGPQELILEGSDAILLPTAPHQVEPRRVEEGPTIDGRLDDEAWLQAAVIDNFVQQEPSEGDPATERTVVRLIYDERALYIGVEAYDSDPDGVVATEKRRDSIRLLDEDNFQVILDTFQDRRSGYMFVTSPLGAKLEQTGCRGRRRRIRG